MLITAMLVALCGWLDDLACKGTETDLLYCNSRGWGVSVCTANEDAGFLSLFLNFLFPSVLKACCLLVIELTSRKNISLKVIHVLVKG